LGGISGTSVADWRDSLNSNSYWRIIDREVDSCVGVWDLLPNLLSNEKAVTKASKSGWIGKVFGGKKEDDNEDDKMDNMVWELREKLCREWADSFMQGLQGQHGYSVEEACSENKNFGQFRNPLPRNPSSKPPFLRVSDGKCADYQYVPIRSERTCQDAIAFLGMQGYGKGNQDEALYGLMHKYMLKEGGQGDPISNGLKIKWGKDFYQKGPEGCTYIWRDNERHQSGALLLLSDHTRGNGVTGEWTSIGGGDQICERLDVE